MADKENKSEERRKRVRYENRKASILKQGRELSTLCGVKLCLMIVTPDGKVETWPENRDDVKAILSAADAAPEKKVVAAPSQPTSSDSDQPAMKDCRPRKRSRDPLPQMMGVPDKKTETTMTTNDSTNYNVNGFESLPMLDNTWNLGDDSSTVGINGYSHYFEKNLCHEDPVVCGGSYELPQNGRSKGSDYDLQIQDPSFLYLDYDEDFVGQLWGTGDPFEWNGYKSDVRTMVPPPQPRCFAGSMLDPLINEQPLRQCGSDDGFENILLGGFY
ncbi:unnamed protein product [Cuscuta epithymum]|uniref:MADS-box domain-containing protein n=1 Tax=Cuscuta epithymum TaxID=186058 RepID=A0AAV0D4Q6_9ASTE|nr:unnamed protein product [Cuscuta epithymum]